MSRTTLPDDIENVVASALAEDLGPGDLTGMLIAEESRARARLICREAAVICGIPWFEAAFRQLDHSASFSWTTAEGEKVQADASLCEISAASRALLAAERTAINFLQTLSATASVARQYVQAVAGTGATILDTRKTLPGLRRAQKYAVAVGGAQNHRMGLYDLVLIKENHILATGSISQAVALARSRYPGVKVEVEVETLAELEQALAAQADIIMLDNFDLAGMREAVRITTHRSRLEVSGSVDLSNVRSIAETGVDYISIGALTKNVLAVDLSLRFL
jgi:nicotinate-nucleotide pyrophosphorylase (carboxylating)